MSDWKFALDLIQEVYGDTVARRSQVPYINHILEGITILQDLNADADTIAAWCLHPLVQGDADLVDTMAKQRLHSAAAVPVMLAMEYRARANSHLSWMDTKGP